MAQGYAETGFQTTVANVLGKLPARTYSPAEIIELLQSITPAHKTALIKVARIYATKARYGHEDLIQEAYMRVLGGKREWPKAVATVPFLCGVMRSIAWDWRVEGHQELDVEAVGYEDRTVESRIDIEKIIKGFSDDPIAQKMIIAMMDGARGEELRQVSGLTETAYESKRTKIRRRLEKLVC